MARIPDDELERLKREVSIERLLEARKVELKRVGKDLRGRCPFHGPDEDPSLSVDPERNVFHCFGCGAKGSVVDLVMRLEGVSFRHAVEILMADSPSPSGRSPDRPPPKRSLAPKLPLVVSPDASDGELLTAVAFYYHDTFKRFPDAAEYLASRAIDPEAVVDRFKLGYSNRTLGYHVPRKCAANGSSLRGRLEQLGVMKETGHEAMRGSLTIPLFDGDGQVVQLYGRKIGQGLRPGVPKHLYLSLPLRGVFNLEGLAGSEEVILCEALLDALTFLAAGYPHVTSSFGANGFTDEHLAAFKAYGVTRVLIAYDRDGGGDKGAAELGRKLADEGITSFRVLFPHNLDANDYAQKVRPPAQALGVLLRGAQYLAGPLRTLAVVPARAPAPPPEVVPEPPEHAVEALTEEQEATQRAVEHLSADAAPPYSEPSEPPAPAEQSPTSEPPVSPEPPGPPEELPSLAAVPAPPPEALPAADPGEAASVAASPVPPAPALEVPAEVREHEVLIDLADRHWRVRGLARNLSFEQLRINLLVSHGDHFHVDSLDLYSARQRGVFLKQASEELQVKQELLKRDLGKVLLKLEQLQEEQIRRALEPKQESVVLSEADRAEAMKLLQDPKLLERISADFSTCGLVGEHTNKLVGYLAAVSRKLDKPLAVMVQSSSAAGKSALMEAILAFVPEEERVHYSAMTGQSLFYMGETDLKHKVLAIAEEEGAERASYPLKLLQSEGELTIASTGKDPSSGRLVTHEYHVEGPAAILLTTTAIDLDEELQNRCLVLAVDESREQTIAIHEAQRLSRTRDGAIRKRRRPRVLALHRNAQRLLRPLEIRNPHSPDLTFLNKTTRTRRDQEKYLSLIDAVALLHQHQRQVRSEEVDGEQVEYIEVSLEDIAIANRLAGEALGHMLDELPPQTRLFLDHLRRLVLERCEERGIERSECRFSRWEVCQASGWSYPQVRRHLDRLVDMEYVLVHHGGQGARFVYELLWNGEGRDGAPFVMGLIDVEKLGKASTTTSATTSSKPKALTSSEPTLTPSETTLTPGKANLDPRLTPACPPLDPRLTPGTLEHNSSGDGTSSPGNGRTPQKRTSGPGRETVVVAAASSYQARGAR